MLSRNNTAKINRLYLKLSNLRKVCVYQICQYLCLSINQINDILGLTLEVDELEELVNYSYGYGDILALWKYGLANSKSPTELILGISSKLKLAHLGPYGLGLYSCPTLSTSIDFLVRILNHNSETNYTVHKSSKYTHIRSNFYNKSKDLTQCILIFSLIQIIGFVNELRLKSTYPSFFRMSGYANPELLMYAKANLVCIEENRVKFELLYCNKLMNKPLLLSNNERFKRWEKDIKFSLFELDVGVKEEVISIVYSQLSFKIPSLKEVAKILNLSHRTLQVKLKHEDVTYSDIVNQLQKEEAFYLLENSRLGLKSIASRTGFSSPSSFCRAFKNWTGKRPNEYKIKNLTEIGVNH